MLRVDLLDVGEYSQVATLAKHHTVRGLSLRSNSELKLEARGNPKL